VSLSLSLSLSLPLSLLLSLLLSLSLSLSLSLVHHQNAWDFSIHKTNEARDLRFAVASTLSVTLHEEHIAERSGVRSTGQRALLLLRRITGFLLYLMLQCTCWAAIMYLTAQSGALAGALQESYPALAGAGVATSAVPAAVSIINSMLPPLITAIVKLEKWDSAGKVAKQMTSRLYFAKIFNAGIQVFSYALLIDPVLFTSQQSVFDSSGSNGGSSGGGGGGGGSEGGSGGGGGMIGMLSDITFTSIRAAAQKKFEPPSTGLDDGVSGGGFACRGEMAAAGFFNLMLTEFVVGKVLAAATPLAMMQASKARGKPFVKGEFQVSRSVCGVHVCVHVCVRVCV
jgi:uncharacterized membrane protein YgcG